MAKPDRDVDYMREMFGTTSLITDYGDFPVSKPKETLSIESVIKELEDYLQLPVQASEFPFARGLTTGKRNMASEILTKLKLIQQ